jgi:hypothetical protein
VTKGEPRGTARVAAAVGASLFCLVGACNPFAPDPGLSQMSVQPIGGSIVVLREGDRVEVTGRFAVEPADVIDTRAANARLHLEGGRYALLGPDTRVAVADGATLENLEGAVLAQASQEMTVVFDEVEATTREGILRVERDSASARAAAIDGRAVLGSPGQQPVRLGRLFEVSVAAGEVLDPRPYHLDHDDAWDRRYLTNVVELDLQLQRYARALSAQTAGSRPGASYFADLAGSEVGFIRPHIERRTPTTDLVIGFTMATVDDARPLRDSFLRAFSLRDRGGQWGVIAALMDVGPTSLLASLERLGSDVLAATEGGATGVTFEAPGGRGAGDGETGSDEDDSVPGAPGPGRSDGDGGGGEKPPPDDCDNVIDCTLQSPPPLPTPETPETGLP